MTGRSFDAASLLARIGQILALSSLMQAADAQNPSSPLAGVWQGQLSSDVICALQVCDVRSSSARALEFEIEITANGRANIRLPEIIRDLVVVEVGSNAIALGRTISVNSAPGASTSNAISLNLSRIDNDTLFIYWLNSSDSSTVPTGGLQGRHGILTRKQTER